MSMDQSGASHFVNWIMSTYSFSSRERKKEWKVELAAVVNDIIRTTDQSKIHLSETW